MNLQLTPSLRAAVCASALAWALAPQAAQAADVSACVITKTDTNPFFVKIREGAVARGEELGVAVKTYAGRVDGDHEAQVSAMEACVADGVKGILLLASDPKSIVDQVRQAREAGILVIALDTPLDPPEAADATFATDNFEAGRLIGAWAKARLGDAAADAKIALLDLSISEPTVAVLRNQGFLSGFGIDLANPDKLADETDPRIVGNDLTNGNEEGGLRAMEALLTKDSGVNLVYTINEPAAAGAHEALKAVGRDKDAVVVSVDGGCPGVRNVRDGVISATAQQYPMDMARMGIEAIAAFAKDGTKPTATEGKSFVDTGVALVTETPVEGVPSIDAAKGLELCWG